EGEGGEGGWGAGWCSGGGEVGGGEGRGGRDHPGDAGADARRLRRVAIGRLACRAGDAGPAQSASGGRDALGPWRGRHSWLRGQGPPQTALESGSRLHSRRGTAPEAAREPGPTLGLGGSCSPPPPP